MTYAFRSLRSRPLESLLLLLTIAFGVALSGLILSLAWPNLGGGSGGPGLFNHEITVQIRAEDNNQFYSSPTAPPVVRIGRVGDARVVMEETDLAKFKAAAPAAKAAYITSDWAMGDLTKNLNVVMASSEYFGALGGTLSQGTLPSAADYQGMRPVVVLTEYGARFLFPKTPALGKNLEGYKVIGVLKMPEYNTYQFRSAQETRFGALGIIPYGATVALGMNGVTLSQGPLSTLRFLALPGRDAELRQQLSLAAQKRWGDRVSISSNAERSAAYAQVARRSALGLAVLGICGLLTASLSVLALMLARVLSRQRQLGMAAALGASRARLRGQYLAEIALLGGLGSVLGGVMAAGLIRWLGQGVDVNRYGDLLVLQPVALLSAVAGGVVLSLLFGLVPAIQASQVRPAEALRA